jgi:hypothetical protein
MGDSAFFSNHKKKKGHHCPAFFLVNLVPLCYHKAMRWIRQKIFPFIFALLLLPLPLFSEAGGPQTAGFTEEEVWQFLEHYKNQYTRKDIGGFVSLFSSNAVQNGRDGFNEIRRIYSDFFGQSQELRYHLEDTRIKIYEEALVFGLFYKSAVLVEARYRVDQILKKTGKKKVWEGDIRWILIGENGALKILSLDFEHQKSQ